MNGQSIYLGNPNGVVIKPKAGQASIIWATPTFSRHGPDRRNPSAQNRPRAGWRPLHHERQNGGSRGQAFFAFEAVVPCHYGTFDALAQDPREFVEALKGANVRVDALPIGGSQIY